MIGTILLVVRILLAVALYAFLVFALWLMWRELRRTSKQTSAGPELPALSLALQNGDVRRRYRYTGPEVTIGRDPTCALRLEDKTISARHARLSYHHGQWWVEDLQSTNGAFLNEELIHEPIVVASGDHLRCGAVEFEITIENNN
jgi:pSer/pThr/pTyr-binding forkhead associated (FHA) protein